MNVRSRTSGISMKGKNFGNDPKDYPVKNVWTTVCQKSELKPNSLKAAFGAGQDVLIATSGNSVCWANRRGS